MDKKSNQNLEEWLISKKHQRENIFMQKRMLRSPNSTFIESESVKSGNDESLAILSKLLQKPNSIECENALKHLKELFAKYPEAISTKFVKIPNALSNLVGIFSNLSIDPKIHCLSAECLTNLSFSNDPNVAERLTNAAGSYLMQFLNSNNQNLVLISLWTLGNLLNNSSQKVWKFLLAQNVEEQLITLTNISNETPIREASLFNLMNLITRNKNEMAKENFCRNDDFIKHLFANLEGSNTNIRGCNIQLYSSWILFYLSFSDEFKVELPFVEILIRQLDTACLSSEEWQMTLIIPSVRIMALLFSRDFTVDTSQNMSITNLINICTKLLQSKYVPLRKESLWLLTNLFTGATHISADLVDNLLEEVIKVNQISISDEIVYLTFTLLYNCVLCEFVSKERCKSVLDVIVCCSQPWLKNEDSLYQELISLLHS